MFSQRAREPRARVEGPRRASSFSGIPVRCSEISVGKRRLLQMSGAAACVHRELGRAEMQANPGILSPSYSSIRSENIF